MGNAKLNAWAQWVLIAGLVIIIVGGFVAYTNIPTQADIDKSAQDAVSVVAANINIPTAEEIAAEVNVPTLKNDNMDDVLEGIYPDEVEDLEDDCINDLEDEFADDALDEIQDLIEASIGEEIKDVSVVDYNYDHDYDFTVNNLGLSDEEDRAGELGVTFRIKYHEVFGDSDWHFEKVEVQGACNDWDKDDNEFDNLNVIYSLA